MYVIQDQKTGSLLEKGNITASQMLLIYWLQQLITVESIADHGCNSVLFDYVLLRLHMFDK